MRAPTRTSRRPPASFNFSWFVAILAAAVVLSGCSSDAPDGERADYTVLDAEEAFYAWLCPYATSPSVLEHFYDELRRFSLVPSGDWEIAVPADYSESIVNFELSPAGTPRPSGPEAEAWAAKYELVPECVRDPSGMVRLSDDDALVVGVMIGLDSQSFRGGYGPLDWDRVARDLGTVDGRPIALSVVDGCTFPVGQTVGDVRRDPVGTMGPLMRIASEPGLTAVVRICATGSEYLAGLGIPTVEVLGTEPHPEGAQSSFTSLPEARESPRDHLLRALREIADDLRRNATSEGEEMVVDIPQLTQSLGARYLSSGDRGNGADSASGVVALIEDLSAAAAHLDATTGRPGPVGGTEIGVFGQVVDGDTFKVRVGTEPRTVRLILIDAPETNGDECHATEASQLLGMLFEPGSRVVLEWDTSDVDRFGRDLRYAYTEEGWMVNELLVAAGGAALSSFPPDTRYEHRIGAAEEFARNEGLGMWAHC